MLARTGNMYFRHRIRKICRQFLFAFAALHGKKRILDPNFAKAQRAPKTGMEKEIPHRHTESHGKNDESMVYSFCFDGACFQVPQRMPSCSALPWIRQGSPEGELNIMENVSKWVDSLSDHMRKTPNEATIDELIARIKDNLEEKQPNMADCVRGIMRFSRPDVIRTFYKQVYLVMDLDAREAWDRTVMEWAGEKSVAPWVIMRVIYVTREKLAIVSTVSNVLSELKWLCQYQNRIPHEGYEALKGTRAVFLRKLLDIDLNLLPDMREPIRSIYAIVFEGNIDPDTVEKYQAFLVNNGLKPASGQETPEAAVKEPQARKAEKTDPHPGQETQKSEKEEKKEPEEMETVPAISPVASPSDSGSTAMEMDAHQLADLNQTDRCDGQDEQDREDGLTGLTGVDHHEEDSFAQTVDPAAQEGLEMAQTLLSWARRQVESNAKKDRKIRALTEELMKTRRSGMDASDKAKSFQTLLTEKEKENERLRQETDDARKEAQRLRSLDAKNQEQIRRLEAVIESHKTREANLLSERDAANDMVTRLQQMSGNSSRQELDGFRYKLAEELRLLARDSKDDFAGETDANRAELYRAFLDDMMEILARNGITIGEK